MFSHLSFKELSSYSDSIQNISHRHCKKRLDNQGHEASHSFLKNVKKYLGYAGLNYCCSSANTGCPKKACSYIEDTPTEKRPGLVYPVTWQAK